MDEFFSHENSSFPPALTVHGHLRTSDSKSELLYCLTSDNIITISQSDDNMSMPSSTCIIFDGAVMVHLNSPAGIMTYSQYVNHVFIRKIKSFAQNATRIDVVFDQYHQHSLKATARAKRGQSAVRRVSPDVLTPRDWKEFLRNECNKTSLFQLIASTLVENIVIHDKEIYTTNGPGVLSNGQMTNAIFPCSLEEADSRMLLHAFDAARKGHTSILLRSVDTDVIIVAVALFHELNVDHLWVAHGSGRHFKYIPIHQIANAMGPSAGVALLFFHAFTGCDTVSAFHGIGKKTAWATWKALPHMTSTFLALSSRPQEVTDDNFKNLERFVIAMYDKGCSSVHINDARKALFCQKGRPIERIPPTAGTLQQHIHRAAYQAGHVWYCSLSIHVELPSPLMWGWRMDSGRIEPLWTVYPEVSKACKELIRCCCKKGCSKSRCKCLRSGLPCTDLCKCGGCQM